MYLNNGKILKKEASYALCLAPCAPMAYKESRRWSRENAIQAV
jgi:hypothetical protein